MGLCVSEENSNVNIDTKLKRVSAEIAHRQSAINKEIEFEEKKILREFGKDIKSRNKYQEEVLAQEIVIRKNHLESTKPFILVYDIVQYHLKKLKDFNARFSADKID